jgi:hypothetical protein
MQKNSAQTSDETKPTPTQLSPRELKKELISTSIKSKTPAFLFPADSDSLSPREDGVLSSVEYLSTTKFSDDAINLHNEL